MNIFILLLQGAIFLALLRIDRKITMNQAEMAQFLRNFGTGLSDISDQLSKATDEIVKAVQNQSDVSPELQAAVDALTPVKDALATKSQTLDDLNPDAPPPSP